MKVEHTKGEFEKLKQQAKALFIHDKLSLKETSVKTGVPYNTMRKWAAAGGWKLLRRKFELLYEEHHACLLAELAEMNESIREKPEGQRFPDLKEARLRSGLIADILQLERERALEALRAFGFSFRDLLENAG